jgi:hypothetical protein
MLISSYVMKHIIINKNKVLYKLFHTLFALDNKKGEKNIRIRIRFVSEIYIYYLRRYMIDLRFTFHEYLQDQY